MDSEIEALADEVERLRGSSRVSAEVEEAVRETLDEVREEYEDLRGEGAYRQHILSYIQEERRRLHERDREDPLCRCRIRCALKRGRIPARVRSEDSIEEGIHSYQERHSEALVLLEAREAWSVNKATVRKALSDAKALLKRGEVDRPSSSTEDESEEIDDVDDVEETEVATEGAHGQA